MSTRGKSGLRKCRGSSKFSIARSQQDEHCVYVVRIGIEVLVKCPGQQVREGRDGDLNIVRTFIRLLLIRAKYRSLSRASKKSK